MSKYCIVLGAVAFFAIIYSFNAEEIIDCQRPPKLVDPAQCCQERGYEAVTEKCAKRMRSVGEPRGSVSTTCLAECILTEMKYMKQPEAVDFAAISTDLRSRFGDDPSHFQTMLDAFQKCQPRALRKMQALKLVPVSSEPCSPFAGLLLGCTYMEYFKNCPAHRWTERTECALAKRFVKQCVLLDDDDADDEEEDTRGAEEDEDAYEEGEEEGEEEEEEDNAEKHETVNLAVLSL